METSGNITAAVFAAYLKCPTKAYLTAHGEKPPETWFAETRGRVSAAYKASASKNLRPGSTDVASMDFLGLSDHPAGDAATLFVDCETTRYACNQPASAQIGRRDKRSEFGHDFVPILYSAWDRSDQSDELLVYLGALAIGQAVGIIRRAGR